MSERKLTGFPASFFQRISNLNLTYVLLWALAILFTILAYLKSPALAYQGGSAAVRLFFSILPGMLAGFLLGGLIQVLLPRDLVAAWAGEGSGLRGLGVATLAGAITPGGPFLQFPLVASLWKAGAGIGPMVAYICSWMLLGMQRILVYEAPILGWRMTSARIMVCLAAPILLGGLAGWLYRRLYDF